MRFVSISNEIKVSQWEDGTETHCYKPKSLENLLLNSVSWGKNGAWLLYVQNYNTAEIVSLGATPKQLHSIRNVKSATCAVFQNSTKRNIAIGTSLGQLVIYDIKDKCIKRQFPKQTMPIFKVQFTSRDAHIVAGCKDGKAYVYRSSSAMQTAALTVPKSSTLTNFRCHPSKSNIVGVCSGEGVVAVWDYNVGKPTSHFNAHNAPVCDMVLQQESVISVGLDRRISLFDHRLGQQTSEMVFTYNPSALDLANDGHSLVIGHTDGNIFGYDLRCFNETTGLLANHSNKKIVQIAFDNFTVGKHESVISEEPSGDSVSHAHTQNTPTARLSNSNMNGSNDSFLNALGLDHAMSINNSVGEAHAGTNVTAMVDFNNSADKDVEGEVAVKPHLLTPVENSLKIKPRKSVEATKAHSTPLGAMALSPIISARGALREEDVRRIVREELGDVRKELAEIKKEMKFYMHEVLYSIKQNTLGVQWSLTKLSVNNDEHFDNLHDLLKEDEPNFK